MGNMLHYPDIEILHKPDCTFSRLCPFPADSCSSQTFCGCDALRSPPPLLLRVALLGGAQAGRHRLLKLPTHPALPEAPSQSKRPHRIQ